MNKLKVLLVDDEVKIREGFKRLFDWESHDLEVIGEASDGLEALSRIDEYKPNIVVMDINIPIMNGLKVIEMSKLRHPNTAFIIVSGYDDFNYCKQALKLQIADYLLKPVDYEEFGAVIDNLRISLYEKKIEEDVDDHLINKIAQYIREHLNEDISLNLLSDRFALNAQYISQLFKNQIGVNFLSYLTSIRMQKAKSLLLSSAKTIVEVSESVGYNDYRVFTKVFKKHVGVSPSQYRKEFLSDSN